MLKLKPQDFGHLMQTADLLENILMVGKTEGSKPGQRARWFDGITNAMNVNLGKLKETLRDREACRAAVHGGLKESDTTGQLHIFFLGHNHPEKAMATHSSTLAWTVPRTEGPGRLQSMGSLRVTTERLHFHFSLSCTGEASGNPLQCSCLENPRDGGAWWANIYGVAQSWTRLKRLSSSGSIITT